MRFAWFAVWLSTFGQVALAVGTLARTCLLVFPVLLPVVEPESIHLRFPVKAIALSSDLWGGAKPADFAARYYPAETPTAQGTMPKFFGPRDLEVRARSLAADRVDERSVTYVSPLGDGTQIKLHLATGELLITNAKGELGCFAKLPVGQRSLAADGTTAQLFGRLSGIVTAPQKLGQTPKRYAQLTSGESVPSGGFPGENHLVTHVDKHVLGILGNTSLLRSADRVRMARTTANGYRAEFADMQAVFFRDFDAAKGNPIKEEKAYADLKAAYVTRAETFMKSEKASILTITRADKKMVEGKETVQLLGFRYDTLTNEMAIFDRANNRIITYFRVDMDPANKWLEKNGYPPVNTPLEYFLSVGKIPNRSLAGTP